MNLRTAERIVLACAFGYRLPEPTRLADRLVAAAKRAAAVDPQLSILCVLRRLPGRIDTT